VDEEQIKFLPRVKFPSLKHIRVTVDPNEHTEAKVLGCYAAIMVHGYDQWARLYFLDAIGSREWDMGRFIDALFEVRERYGDIQFLIEDAHMTHFVHALRMEEEKRGVKLRIQWIPIHGQKSKYERWTRIQPRFQHGDVFFAEEINSAIKVEIKDELVRGTAARFYDFLDCMAMAEMGVRPRIDKTGQPVPMPTEAPVTPDKPRPVPVVAYADLIPGIGKFFDSKKVN
jgi:hypothetical protein